MKSKQQKNSMAIYLGNLSIGDIEKRSGIKFPQELINYMEPRRQENIKNIKQGQWHCFYPPFTLICGDIETANEIYKYLKEFSHDFKEVMEIAVDFETYDEYLDARDEWKAAELHEKQATDSK